MCAAERRFRDDSVVMRRQHPTASNSISRWFTEPVKTAPSMPLSLFYLADCPVGFAVVSVRLIHGTRLVS